MNVRKGKLVCERVSEWVRDRKRKVPPPTETSVSSRWELLWTLTNTKRVLAELVLALAVNKLVVNKLKRSTEKQANRFWPSVKSKRNNAFLFTLISFEMLLCLHEIALPVSSTRVNGWLPCFNELRRGLSGQLRYNSRLTVVSNR